MFQVIYTTFSLHLRHINFSPPGGIWILPWEINRLSLCLWRWAIFKDGIRIHNCLFTQDKRIICIQILFSGYNLILVKAFGCGKKLLLESDSSNCFGMRTKGFPVFRLFLDDGIIVLMASPSWLCVFVTELMIWHTIVVRELQNLRQIACISTTIPLFLSLIFVVSYHRSQVCIYEFSWIYFEIEAPAEWSHINSSQKPLSCKAFHKRGA